MLPARKFRTNFGSNVNGLINRNQKPYEGLKYLNETETKEVRKSQPVVI